MPWEVAVVDGAPASRRHLELALGSAGYGVVGWSNAEAARAELAVNRPRVLVCELLMEGMDGFDLLAWARQQWRSEVQLVATSGIAWGHVSLAHIVRERFGARFLAKPFLRSEAVKLVEEAIGGAPPAGPRPVPPEWRIGVAEAQRLQTLAQQYERRLVRLGNLRGRTSVRTRAECTVKVNYLGEWVPRSVGNLSAGGLFVESETAQEPDQILELALDIPPLQRTFRLQARVAYRVSADRVSRGERPGFGVEFLDISEGDRAAIQQFVLDQSEGEGDAPGKAEPAARDPAPRRRGATRSTVLLVGLPTQQLLGRPGFLHRRGFEVVTAPAIEDAADLARLHKPALCVVHEKTIRLDPHRMLMQLGRLVDAAASIIVLGPTTLSSLLAAGLCGVVLPPDIPTLLLNDEIRQRLGIAERAALRVPYQAPVAVSAQGRQVEGEMVDVSVGGILLRTPQPLSMGTEVEVTFDLPGAPGLSAQGAVVRTERERSERGGRCGVAFLDLSPAALDAVRRFVQSHVPFQDFFGWLKQAYFE
jgi:DNA-binding response OmpR family regulator/c-di-GMP-binding flagellar brake protein YcgR